MLRIHPVITLFLAVGLASSGSWAGAEDWSTPEAVNPGAITALDSADLITANGDVHVVYRGDLGGFEGIFYQRQANGVWSGAQVLAVLSGETVGVMNLEEVAGVLYAIYDLRTGGAGKVFFSDDGGTNGAAWSTPQVIHPDMDATPRNNANVRTGANGTEIMAVWQASDPRGVHGGDLDIWHSVFAAGVWSAPAVLNPDNNATDFMADVAYAPTGDAYCVYSTLENRDGTGTDPDIFLIQRTVPGAVATPVLVNTNAAVDTNLDINPRIQIEQVNGEAVVVWEANDDLLYTTFVPDEKGITIPPAFLSTYMPADGQSDRNVLLLAVDNEAFALWVSQFNLDESGTDTDLFWSHFRDGAWDAPEFVNPADADESMRNEFPALATNGFNAHAVWFDRAGTLFYQQAALLTDTDNDGIADVFETNTGVFVDETNTGTNPIVADTDGDGMSDGFELDNGLNPFVNDANEDADNDGLTNLEEFQRGSDPDNAADPPPFVFVNGVSGSDETGDGTANNPFQTITSGIAKAQTETRPNRFITVQVTAGTYNEILTVPVRVKIRGAGSLNTFIEPPSGGALPNILVTMGDDSALLDVTVRWAAQRNTASTLVQALLTNANTMFEIGRCVLDGLNSTDSIGIAITGGSRDNARIFESTLRNLTTAFLATSSGVNITRNEIRNIQGAAVIVQTAKSGPKQGDPSVPLLGDSADIETTALNRWRETSDTIVNNNTGGSVLAEVNDWGIYNKEQVAPVMSGDVNVGPIMGKSIAPGSVIASLYIGDTDELVPAGTDPVCSIPELNLTSERDAESGLYIFSSVQGGSWSIEAEALGFIKDVRNVNVSAASINPVNMRLGVVATPQPPSCGKQGKATYAFCGLLIWASTRRMRKSSKSRH